MSPLKSLMLHSPRKSSYIVAAPEGESLKSMPRELRGHDFVEVVRPPREAQSWHPLTAAAATVIIRHMELVVSKDRLPGAGNRPVFMMSFRPSDGFFFGTSLDAHVNEHADRFIRLPSNRVPTMAELGQILVSDIGTIKWEGHES
jgi:hypothetical protein